MLTRIAFNHNQSQEAEQEYDRLRDLARQEAGKRSSCFDRVRRMSFPLKRKSLLMIRLAGASGIRTRRWSNSAPTLGGG